MKLYIFEHCPFCVKSLMVANELGIDYEKCYLLNDDELTPNRLVGKKLVPILEKDDGSAMGESLDIARYFTEVARQPLTDGEHLGAAQSWVERHLETILRLTFVRWPDLKLPEYATQGAVQYYTEKKEQRLGASFNEVREATSTDLDKIHQAFEEINWLGESEHLQWQDVALFPFLRNLSVVKGLTMPEQVKQYVDSLAQRCNISTFFNKAV